MVDLIAVSEVYREWLAWLCLRGLFLLSSALVLWWLVNVVSGPVLRLWRRLTFFGRVAVCSLFGFGVIDAGIKTNPPPSRMVGPPLVVTVSADDVSRGWRVESVTTNVVPSAGMPSNAVYVGNWHVHGARSSFGRNVIDFGAGWSFPLGTSSAAFSSFWYFVDGRIRPTPKDAAHEICAVGVPMSAVPGQSQLWTLAEDDDSRVLTWENFFLGGDTNSPVNAQIRLFANGDFTTRSNNVETVCRRVNPDDWDGDGLANEKDMNPLAYDGDFFGVPNALPTNANLDAYYQLDVAAAGALDFATIRVTCDGPSDLGDHVVVARTNQVCHVPLLAGATYAVESDLPIAYSAVSSEHAHIVTNSTTNLTVSLPLEFTVERVEMRGGGSDTYLVQTSPINVGPRVIDVSGVCCSCTTNGTGFTWNCSEGCDCRGYWHDPVALAVWGGYSRPFAWHGWCPCAWNGAGGGSPLLVLDTPDTLFTNNDGGAEASDVARLVAGLFSSVGTNGTLTLEVSDDSAVKVWTTSNRTELVSLPVTWNVADTPCRAFYVEGAYERARGDVSFGLKWRGGQGDVLQSADAGLAVYYPILNVINSSLFDSGDVCNPCGIVVGTNACFALEFGGVHPPASEIRWSVVEGSARFVDDNDTGERVRVFSTVPGHRVTLRAQIGNCRSRPPEISAYVVEPLSVKLTVWIVGNDLGTYYASDAATVSNMVRGVNKIYEQIGVSFYIDSICHTNREAWLDLRKKDNGKCNLELRSELVSLTNNTQGLELYFVDSVAKGVKANHDDYGIVIGTNVTAKTIAHEIGHAFGCADVYPTQKKNPKIHIPNATVCEYHEPMDWSNGTGCRYYRVGISQEELIKRLLMCGRSYQTRYDMSSGLIYGFTEYGEDGRVDAGFFWSGTRRNVRYHK